MRPALYAALACVAFLLPAGAHADNWQTSFETSPIDDSQNVYLSVVSDDPIEDRISGPQHPVLWAFCKENHTEVMIEAAFEARDQTTVTMRMDSDKAQHVTWVRSNDGKALYYEGGSPITLLGQLAKHHSVYVEWTPFDSPTYHARFQLDTLATVLSELQKACHWTPAETSAKAAAVATAKAAVKAKEDAPNSPELQAILDGMRTTQ
jgi:type VI secretion system protein VasI